MTFAAALIIGIMYWFSFAESYLFNCLKEPIFIGVVVGAMFGDVATGLQVGAQIQLLYIASRGIGGNLPADKTVAAYVAVPVVILNNLAPELALPIAIPLASIGASVDSLRRMLNGFWNRKAYNDIEKLNITQLYLDGLLYPFLTQFPLRVIPLTMLLYLGSDSVGPIVAMMPEWIQNGLEIAGGVLPAMGMIVAVKAIGRTNLLPYFILGFFIMLMTGLPVLVLAIFAGILAILTVGIPDKSEIGIYQNFEETESPKELKYALTKKDLSLYRFMCLYTWKISQSLEALYGTGFGVASIHCLKRLYSHDPEKFKEALRRHFCPYITEAMFGASISGAAMAMEEQYANGAPMDPHTISSLRTGLMGPFAGFGDSIIQFTIRPIIYAIAVALAFDGTPFAALLMFYHMVLAFVIGFPAFNTGYRLGKESLLNILKGGWINKLILGTGVLGMTMIGALSASYVKLSTPVEFTIGESAFVVQDFLNRILPGLLPLVLLGISYWYMGRPKAKVMHLMVAYIAVGLVGSFIGIL